jgi:hypothetical protein
MATKSRLVREAAGERTFVVVLDAGRSPSSRHQLICAVADALNSASP